jgi:aryl-alcohol dehydrogenase-like predicted oxidoreductase
MDYVNLGKTGLKVSRLCLGCMSFSVKPPADSWLLDEETSRPLIAQALEQGINFFDTANIYADGGSEVVLGRAIRDFGVRDEVVIATKLYFPMRQDPNGRGLSRKAIFTEIDASLRRLGTDYVDLYQIHRWDEETPIEETLEALHDVVKAGKARYIGASTMPAWRFAKTLFTADLHGWTRFVSMQPQYNLIVRDEEREMLPLCLDQGIGVIPWSPLARGFLAGNRAREGGGETARARQDGIATGRFYHDSDFDQVERVTEVARARGAPNAQVALAWVLANPAVTSPSIGATKPGQLDDAVAALALKLEAGEIERLEGPRRETVSTHRR